MSKKKKFYNLSIILFFISLIYTILVKTIDVAPIGPNNSLVGFSTLNGFIHEKIGFNLLFYNLTKYLGFMAFGIVAFYVALAIKDFLNNKDFKKIDKKFYLLGEFYILFAIIYIFFENVIINYRPILMDGALEASYPSSHTLLAMCICGSSLIVSKYFIKNQNFRKYFNIVTFLLMIFIIIGRIISGVHWFSDIIGGIIIGLFLLSLLRGTKGQT